MCLSVCQLSGIDLAEQRYRSTSAAQQPPRQRTYHWDARMPHSGRSSTCAASTAVCTVSACISACKGILSCRPSISDTVALLHTHRLRQWRRRHRHGSGWRRLLVSCCLCNSRARRVLVIVLMRKAMRVSHSSWGSHTVLRGAFRNMSPNHDVMKLFSLTDATLPACCIARPLREVACAFFPAKTTST